MQRHFEIRRADDGAIDGVAMRYGAVSKPLADGTRERFEPRSIVPLPPVALYLDHQPGMILAAQGAGLELADSDSALEFRARFPEPLSDVQRRAQANVDAGILRYASVTFEAIQSRLEGGVTVIERALMPAISLTANPAYVESHLYRNSRLAAPSAPVTPFDGSLDAVGQGNFEIRQGGGLAGVFRFGLPVITSLARRRKLLIPPDADIGLADDIFALDGVNYDRRFASSAAGALLVERTAEGVAFATVAQKLAQSPQYRNVAANIRAGLTKGLTLGLQRTDSDSYLDDDGYTVERVRRGAVCELYFVARSNDAGQVQQRPARRSQRRPL